MEVTAITLVKSPAWLLVAARMIHFLVVMCPSLSLPPQSSCGGLDEGDNIVDVVPLDGGHGDHLDQVLGMVAGGGKDYPLLSGDVLVYISPTTVASRWP